jgi:hypothetical protein
MSIGGEMNARVSEWSEAARAQAAIAAVKVRKRLQRGLKTAASGAGQVARLTDRLAAVGAALGSVAMRGSRELAASNLKLSRELLLATQEHLEHAAAAESLRAALRGQIASWPATRERLSAGLRTYREALSRTLIDLQRATAGANAGARRTKSAGAPKRRRRSRAKARA